MEIAAKSSSTRRTAEALLPQAGGQSPGPVGPAIPREATPPTGNMKAYRIPNLARACQVMRLFAYSDERLSSSAVARRLKIPRTTVLRILHTLTAERLLQRRGCDFSASRELSRLGLRTLGENGIPMAAGPVLSELAAESGASAHLALLADDKAVVAGIHENGAGGRAGSRPGALLDLHASAAGKVFLALAPQPCLETLLAMGPLEAHTARTITHPAALEIECAKVAQQGYAVERGEQRDGTFAVAAPVRDASGALVAALGVTLAKPAVSEAEIAAAGAQVVRAAHRLGRLVGEGSPAVRSGNA